MKSLTLVTSALAAAALSAPLLAQQPTQPKPATEATKAANRAVQEYLNFNDKRDFEDAQRGFIGKPDVMTIKNAEGQALTVSSSACSTLPVLV